ncbi:MAG: uncharacterized protein JWN44_2394, partial [Myxococcales bacterium]|nr:uncharacterized protein [Myxococcales bacterium]
ANAVVWFLQLAHGVDQSVLDYGAIPTLLLHHATDANIVVPGALEGPMRLAVHQLTPWPTTLLTSMFMHGSWLHLIGNMWFLWIFGDNVEDAMGPLKYLVFYLVCGFLAALSQVFTSIDSAMPMVGASGAIAGVLGAYLHLYPRARVRCLWVLFIIITFVYVPAWLILGLWFISQFFIPGAGVAWMAHVGGFIAGFALVRLFVRRAPPPRRDHFPAMWSRS